MSADKPNLRVISRPDMVEPRESAIDAARRRFGQRFAHEPGSTWKPRQQPLLLEWLSSRPQRKPLK